MKTQAKSIWLEDFFINFQYQQQYISSVSGIVVSIAAFQAVDPGSIPGWRIVFLLLLSFK